MCRINEVKFLIVIPFCIGQNQTQIVIIVTMIFVDFEKDAYPQCYHLPTAFCLYDSVPVFIFQLVNYVIFGVSQ